MATTTDLGKIMTTNGGEYDPETTYSEKTFVYYKGSTYLALKTNTGIEPSDDKINWQYFARGFADEDFVAEKYVYVDREDDSEFVDEPLIDADALGGNKPDFYAPQHEISDAFDDAKSYDIGNYCIYLNSLYRFTSPHSPGAFDGTEVVPVTIAGEITQLNSNFGKIEIKNYRYELMVQSMSFVKRNGIVSICYDSDWKSIPAGDLGIIARVDPEFYPIQSVRCMAFPDTSLQLTLSPQGDLFAYNYGSAFTSIKSARFFVSYVAAN